jgi:eukaryotic-like serine/threonine-protein kinase
VSARPALRRGARVDGRYRLIERLARGRNLDVWDAWSDERDCRVILKTLRPDRREDRAARARLLAEGRLLVELSHPHIVRGYEMLERPEAVVVMETLAGHTVAHLIDHARRRMALGDASMLGLHLCSAVGYLHRQGRVHLDLKPSNVVAEAGRAKVIDLGFARPPGRVRAGLGTWCYMAPEQSRGGTAGPPADVWGIGAILHEALAGEATFDRLDGDGFELPYPQLARRAEPLRRLRRVPPGIAAAIDACLDPDPAGRPSIGVLAAALS